MFPEFSTVHLSVIIAMMSPFMAIGVIRIIGIFSEKMRVKKGYIRTLQVLKNSRIITKLNLPEGKKMKLDRKGLEMPFTNEPGYIAFDGTTPVALFDDSGRQLMFKPEKNKNVIDIDKKYFNDMTNEAYNLGVSVGSGGKQDKTSLILLLCLILSGAAAAFSLLGFVGVGGA